MSEYREIEWRGWSEAGLAQHRQELDDELARLRGINASTAVDALVAAGGLDANDLPAQIKVLEAFRKDPEIRDAQVKAAQAAARTKKLQENLEETQACINELAQKELQCRRRDADAAVSELVARCIVPEFDSEGLEDYRQKFIADPDFMRLVLRLPGNRIRRL